MKNQKAMIIMGAAGSGKSRRALAEAEKRGNYVVTTWQEIRGKFGLAVLGCCPATVIVDELPPGVLKKAADLEYLKQLATCTEVLIEEKHKHPRTVLAPMFIFTMQTPPKPDLSLLSGKCRRFELVEV